MSEKTNAARILDRLKIKYELVEYTVDPDNLAADHVAEELGEPIEQVYKTLVLRGDKTGIIVCVVAGNREVDLKKAAKASGNKKVEMIAMKEPSPSHRIYTWRLHCHRDEEALPHLYQRGGTAFPLHIRECRKTRTATEGSHPLIWQRQHRHLLLR